MCISHRVQKRFFPFFMLKITTKSIYFLPAKKKIPILWIELQTKTLEVLKPHIYRHRAVKNSQIAKTFQKNVNKEAM